MNAKVIAGVVVGVLAVAIILIGMMPQEGRTVEVELGDFIFIFKDVEEPLRVKAGESVTFKITNRGGFTHEFMVVSEDMKNIMFMRAQELFQELMDQGLEGEELIETFEKEFAHREEASEAGAAGMLGEAVLEPGESTELTIMFEKPGTYYVVCFEVEGTGQAGKTHADQGMIFKIVVEE